MGKKVEKAKQEWQSYHNWVLEQYNKYLPEGDARLKAAWSELMWLIKNGFVTPMGDWAELFKEIDPGVAEFMEKIESVKPDFAESWEDLPPILRDTILPLIGARQAADEIIRYRGRTEDTAYILDRAKDIMGAKTPEQQARLQKALETLASWGYTPKMEAQRKALETITSTYGQTPETREMYGAGMELVRKGGWTPALERLKADIQAQLEKGAKLPEETRRLYRRMLDIIERGGEGGAVLPLRKVAAVTEEAATRQYRQAKEAAERQAAQRLGTAAVSAGTAEGALTEQYPASFEPGTRAGTTGAPACSSAADDRSHADSVRHRPRSNAVERGAAYLWRFRTG